MDWRGIPSLNSLRAFSAVADTLNFSQAGRELNVSHAAVSQQVRALDGVSMEVRSGEFTAIMGASGSGKSTLLNLLGCLDTPTRGRYLLRGQSIDRMDDDALAFSQRIPLRLLICQRASTCPDAETRPRQRAQLDILAVSRTAPGPASAKSPMASRGFDSATANACR